VSWRQIAEVAGSVVDHDKRVRRQARAAAPEVRRNDRRENGMDWDLSRGAGSRLWFEL